MTETTIHIITATVRNAERKVVEADTLCGQTIEGQPVDGMVNCPECLRRDAL